MRLVRRARGTLERWVGNDVLLASTEHDDVLRLGGTAAVIWSFLDEGVDLDDLGRELCATYGADPETVGRDVDELVDRLVGERYAEVCA